VNPRPGQLTGHRELRYTRGGGTLEPITPETVRQALLYLAALIASVSVHEFGHAWVATRLGDPLPAAQGRVTLSPARHIDLVGTVIFPLVMFFAHFPLLGWGKPVETNRLAYTRRISPVTGHLLVSLAGPMMNLLLVGVVSLVLVALGRAGVIGGATFTKVYGTLIGLNFILFFLNLLPMPPLDGGAILEWLLPRSQRHIVDLLARWGFIILFGLSVIGWLGYLLIPAGIAANAWQSILQRAAGL
jgi:Zn-dependent protease